MEASLPIVDKSYEAIKTLTKLNDTLTKRWRFTLGKNIEDSLLTCLQEIIMAKHAPKPLRATYLIKAISYLETTMIKLRLYLDLKLANETSIFQLQNMLMEIGRMLGGWKRATLSQ